MDTGQTIASRYTLTRQLGKGGMGEVWLAEDSELKRRVAVKGLRPDAVDSDGLLRRLTDEGFVHASVSHQHVVPLFDMVAEDKKIYLVMQYVEGTDLQSAGASGALDTAAKVRILMEVLDALDHLHGVEVKHRDLKPSNILLNTKNQAYVADFGIAKQRTAEGATQSLRVIGTPEYIAPEIQFFGQRATYSHPTSGPSARSRNGCSPEPSPRAVFPPPFSPAPTRR